MKDIYPLNAWAMEVNLYNKTFENRKKETDRYNHSNRKISRKISHLRKGAQSKAYINRICECSQKYMNEFYSFATAAADALKAKTGQFKDARNARFLNTLNSTLTLT